MKADMSEQVYGHMSTKDCDKRCQKQLMPVLPELSLNSFGQQLPGGQLLQLLSLPHVFTAEYLTSAMSRQRQHIQIQQLVAFSNFEHFYFSSVVFNPEKHIGYLISVVQYTQTEK